VAAFREPLSDPAGSENPCMCVISHAENREVSWSPACRDGGAGRAGNAVGGNPVMHDREKSDGLVVPAKLSNNTQDGAAESVEGSGPVKGNTTSETRSGHSAGQSALSKLDRVRRMAATDKEARLTALLRHVDLDRLRAAYLALRPRAAPGVDGAAWADYGVDLQENLKDLHARVHGARIGQDRRGGCSVRNRMGGYGRSGSLRWRTRSCSGRWQRC
jgi:hypothetical protein